MKLEIRIISDSNLKQQILQGFAELAAGHDLEKTGTGTVDDRFELVFCHKAESPESFLLNLKDFIIKTENSLPSGHQIEVLVKNSEYSEPALWTAQRNRPSTLVEGFRVVPWPDSKDTEPEPQDIYLDPSADAFGNGLHPSTQLCLRLLRQATTDAAGTRLTTYSVLDAGCGSGILAIAALRLGASSVLGVEIDHHAAETARRNMALNRLEESAEILQASYRSIIGHYDLVLANLVPSVLGKAAPHLAKLLTSRGLLITAGFPEVQSGRFLELLENHGLQLLRRSSLNGWGALLLSPQQ